MIVNAEHSQPKSPPLGSPSASSALPSGEAAHRGWYSRGYLPHCDFPGLLQAITYRLADSLPAAALERMDAELHSLPSQQRDQE